MSVELFTYKGDTYPDYLRTGNASQFILPFALKFCQGRGVDVGAGKWKFPGAEPVDLIFGGNANELPGGPFDYVFSSHCLEHLVNPVESIIHWQSKLVNGGVLFLYLPHPDQKYWRPQNCRKHLHSWYPHQIVDMLVDLGFSNVIHSERDLAWSFAVVGFNLKD